VSAPEATAESDLDLLTLDEALNRLAEVDARKSKVVELRFFGGLGVKETAEVMKVSADTVMRDWKLAKVWLLRELAGAPAMELEGWHRMAQLRLHYYESRA
jgi:DNA-directed RNA polymerase specialized sigma24 family protein